MGESTSGRGARGRSSRRDDKSRRSRPVPRRTRSRSSDDDVAALADAVAPQPSAEPAEDRRSARGRGGPSPARRSMASRFGHVDPKRAAVIALVVVFLALTLAVPVRTYLSQRSEFNELQQENAELQRQVADYEHKVVEQNDPAYIEAKARERLQMVKRGERQVIVIAPNKEQQEAAERAEREREANPWYQNIWDAVSTPPEGK
ncbi:septum formation initiator family protein [Gordonia sp. HY002]|uniref:FtsB family cell division protein n=1 Tax=Gordonia zhenghanii TaxID=2911516 RepID=UPI001EF02595|nr:septum formation initiator family protein [Gordonia zhenghanii]MCF8572044.1 septum formation initiator family protein [Gordonia zhenghanii]MCF8602918.1 septum formation initiator family protein [Gordonia zhenghanii]